MAKYECAFCLVGTTEEGMSYCEECWEQWLAEQGYWEEIEGENDTNGRSIVTGKQIGRAHV